MPANRNDRIFLCHASEDSSQVDAIYRRLKSAGLNPWIDKKDLPPARSWDAEIQKALATARLVLVFLSNNLIAKTGYVQREIEIALATPRDSTFVIPVRLDPCLIPEALTGLSRFDLFEDLGIENLVEHIKAAQGLFTDPRDGQVYRTIIVGTRTWMAANLNHPVPNSWWFDDDPLNGRRHGRLYTWESAQLACPDGWHIPTDSEWKELASDFGGYRDMDEGYVGTGMPMGNPQAAYEALIAGGESGFDAGLAGYRSSAGEFLELNKTALFWTASGCQYSDFGNFEPVFPREIKTAWIYYFYRLASVPEIRRDRQIPLRADLYPRGCGLSVRCVKNK